MHDQGDIDDEENDADRHGSLWTCAGRAVQAALLR
jgi:hypothetical protein